MYTEFLCISLLEGIYVHGQRGNLKITLRCRLGGWILMMGGRWHLISCQRVRLELTVLPHQVLQLASFLVHPRYIMAYGKVCLEICQCFFKYWWYFLGELVRFLLQVAYCTNVRVFSSIETKQTTLEAKRSTPSITQSEGKHELNYDIWYIG